MTVGSLVNITKQDTFHRNEQTVPCARVALACCVDSLSSPVRNLVCFVSSFLCYVVKQDCSSVVILGILIYPWIAPISFFSGTLNILPRFGTGLTRI